MRLGPSILYLFYLFVLLSSRKSPSLSQWPPPPQTRILASPLDDFRSSEAVPEMVDVVIIGSGLSGACAAYQLLAGTPNTSTPPTIAIFEARQACSGTTGRNGGHMKLTPRVTASFASKYGPAAALEFALFVKELIGKMKECGESVIVKEEKSLMEECEMLVTRSWDVFLDEEHAADITSIRGAKAAFSCPALSLWPYKFVLGLLRHVLNLGAKLYTLTLVTSLERVSDDGTGSHPTSLQTPRGTTLARKVIFATNACASNILPQYSNTIIPGRGVTMNPIG
ncbi:hypothetical protein BDZ45DRAFT_592156 [Acephala macrosclerotiorum]|nr:hypothetical protein BDZ45DRAFT_592156 [Acephala macrosclerotiorum]